MEKVYEEKVKNMINKAYNKGIVKTYAEFAKETLAEETCLSEEEVKYYVSNEKDYKKLKFNVGDIVFVDNYQYKGRFREIY